MHSNRRLQLDFLLSCWEAWWLGQATKGELEGGDIERKTSVLFLQIMGISSAGSLRSQQVELGSWAKLLRVPSS